MIPKESNYGYQGMEMLRRTALLLDMPLRPLDDRIRELCAGVVTASEGDVSAAISELKAALHEHNDYLRQYAARKLTTVLYSPRDASL